MKFIKRIKDYIELKKFQFQAKRKVKIRKKYCCNKPDIKGSGNEE